jgi:hypothetical protein
MDHIFDKIGLNDGLRTLMKEFILRIVIIWFISVFFLLAKIYAGPKNSLLVHGLHSE